MSRIDEKCIFCKIAGGDIPSNTIYEDDYCRVILDLGPAARGHAIILAKTHAANLFELPDEYAAHLLKVAKKVGAGMMKTLGCDGLNVLQNNGETAGQTVFHLHIHLIPRYKDDNINITWAPGELDDGASLAETIRSAIEKKQNHIHK